MKCEFCTWELLPESIPPLKRHIEANHPDIEEVHTVWRDGEMWASRSIKPTDVAIHVDIFRVKEDVDVPHVEILDAGTTDPAVDALAENAVNEDLETTV